MSNYFFLIVLAFFITACSQSPGTGRMDNTPEKKIRKQVIAIAESYAMDQLKDVEKSVDGNGIIMLGDKQKSYVIDPAKIFIELIDDDSKKDAIVSIDTYQGQYQTVSEHLIIIKSDGKFILITAIESDMNILKVNERIVTAEVPTHSRNSPLFNCPSCREVVNYQFRKGELIRME